jgi:predicted oxidoreductase
LRSKAIRGQSRLRRQIDFVTHCGHSGEIHEFKIRCTGMDLVDSFAEKSMNVALTRLLTGAIHEFISASFDQAVQKSAVEK